YQLPLLIGSAARTRTWKIRSKGGCVAHYTTADQRGSVPTIPNPVAGSGPPVGAPVVPGGGVAGGPRGGAPVTTRGASVGAGGAGGPPHNRSVGSGLRPPTPWKKSLQGFPSYGPVGYGDVSVGCAAAQKYQ